MSNNLYIKQALKLKFVGQLINASPRLEVFLIFSGLLMFSLLYYTRMAWIQALGLFVLILTGVFWGYSLRYLNPMNLRDLRLIRKHWLIYSILGIFTGCFGWGFQHLIHKINFNTWLPLDYKAPLSLVLAIAMVVIAEEIFFRGYIFTRMRVFTKHVWIQILFVSIAWSLYKVVLHLWDGRPPSYYIWLFLTEIYLTIPLTWWVYRTGSLATPLVSHFVWDFLMYGTRDSVPDWVF